MRKEYLENIEKLYADGRYITSARQIASIRLWLEPGTTPELTRQQELISKYDQMDQFELKQLIAEFLNMLRKEKTMDGKIFIVHGRDHELKLETKNYLQNTLGLDCVILHEKDGEGDTIINKFERYAQECTLAVVLLSEKDASDTKGFADPDAPKRPRPNVLFEMGYFFARLGRKNVLILRKGSVEIHSDILGIEYIDVTGGVETAGEKIRRRMSALLRR